MTTSPVSSPVAPALAGPAAMVGSAPGADFAQALARQRASQATPPARTPNAEPPAKPGPQAPRSAQAHAAKTGTGNEAQPDEVDTAQARQQARRARQAAEAPDTPAGAEAWLSRMAQADAAAPRGLDAAGFNPGLAQTDAQMADPDAAVGSEALDTAAPTAATDLRAGVGAAHALVPVAASAQGQTPRSTAANGALAALTDSPTDPGAALAASLATDLAAQATPAARELASDTARGQMLDHTRTLQFTAGNDPGAVGTPADQALAAGGQGASTAPGLAGAALTASPLAPPASPTPLTGSAAAPLPEARLPAPPGHADFAPQLGAQISVFVRDGVQQARLQLNPAEMGPITVQIRLDGSAAQVHLAADNALTRQALEQAMPTLASTLREGGLTLAGGGVFEQPAQPGQANAQGQGTAGEGRGRSAQNNPATDDGSPSYSLDGASLPTGGLRRRGVVDLVA